MRFLCGRTRQVAVLSYRGSFCPVTRGHVACLSAARDVVVERYGHEFRAVLALVNPNGDSFVRATLAGKSRKIACRRRHCILEF